MLGVHQSGSDNGPIQTQFGLSSLPCSEIFFSLLSCCVGVACAGTSHRGDRVDLRGTLTLRGNVPFAYPVVTDGKNTWQLVGLDQATAARLQNRVVHVTGRVAETAGASRLPGV